VLVAFAGGSGSQVVQRRSDDPRGEGTRDFHFAAFQKVEEAFGVLLLLIGGFNENIGDLHQAFFAGLAGKIGVSVARLRFPGEGGQQIFFGARALKLCHFLESSSTAN
jgi:hypothetical protein